MDLKSYTLAELCRMDAAINGFDKPKRHKDKATAIKSIGRPTKQRLVLAMIANGGATVDAIVAALDVKRAYARDIICKLVKKGHRIERQDDNVFRLATSD